jgi:hypothetical protein
MIGDTAEVWSHIKPAIYLRFFVTIRITKIPPLLISFRVAGRVLHQYKKQAKLQFYLVQESKG